MSNQTCNTAPEKQSKQPSGIFFCDRGMPPFSKNIRSFLYLIVFTGCFFLGSCRKKMPDNVETVLALQNLQSLATVEYTITKVVKANDNLDWYKPGDRKILFTCQASVKAGIDLAAIQPGDIEIDGKKISIQLPQPKILTVNMPPENIKLAYSEVGLFRSDFTNAEKDALVAQAEKQIWNAGETAGIIAQARLNTQTFLNNYLLQLGFEKIELTYGEKSPDNIKKSLN
ncbi:MAG: DUF4230 domain-containing protein [Bacteroidota bacterium]